jgi:predicted metal-dependent enzyme (double-stranded beta helix superfamily)
MTITETAPASLGTRVAATPAPAAGCLGPLALLDLLQDYVKETGDLVLQSAQHDPTQRTYELLELNDTMEIWAIHWPKDVRLELHDHGGSSGALWVIGGSLQEAFLERDGSLARRGIVVGGGVAFGPSYVHDVVNVSPTPATSVHVYSPPMASMTFYRQCQDGRGLRVDRAEYRADPAWAP